MTVQTAKENSGIGIQLVPNREVAQIGFFFFSPSGGGGERSELGRSDRNEKVRYKWQIGKKDLICLLCEHSLMVFIFMVIFIGNITCSETPIRNVNAAKF